MPDEALPFWRDHAHSQDEGGLCHKALSVRDRSPVTAWSPMMGGRVDKSEAQSALRVVQALFAFLKKKKRKNYAITQEDQKH